MRLRIKSTISLMLTPCCISQLTLAKEVPQRIISLGPAITKQLYLLGVEDKLEEIIKNYILQK